ICVWVGNADGEGRPGLTGIEKAAPVLFDIFRQLPAGKWFEKPVTKLVKMKVCRESGYKAGEYCSSVIEEVPSAGVKTIICPYHRLIHLDRSATFRVTDQCESPANMKHVSWFVLPPSMEYYYKIKHSDYKELPDLKAGCQVTGNNSMEMIYPKNNALIYIPLEVDGQRGKVILNAAHRNPGKKIYWHIDDNYIGTTINYHQLAASPGPGKHTLTLVDGDGERLSLVFKILSKDK
ncbi:MAG: penicillin-binding protein 1C, partial [Pedobacter sp.]